MRDDVDRETGAPTGSAHIIEGIRNEAEFKNVHGAALMVAASVLSVAPAQALTMHPGGSSCSVLVYYPDRGVGVDAVSCTEAQARISYFAPNGNLVWSTTALESAYVQTVISTDLRLGGQREVRAKLGTALSAWTIV